MKQNYVQAAGSTEVRAIRDAVKGQRFDAPEGPVQIDPATQHTFKTVCIGNILEGRRFEVIYNSEKALPPVPYPPTRSQQVWDEFVTDLHLSWSGQWANPGQRN
jgi:urea transport system substrate-binding protein